MQRTFAGGLRGACAAPAFSLLAACSGAGDLSTAPTPLEPLVLTVESPVADSWLGDATSVTVSGHVTRPDAWVWVEGMRANVGPAGNFSVELPVPGPYRIVDVEA
ncbi:MAG: hypothetical protein H0V89_01780, partial [Deltaproteobacteria bacterium]|nr:hypothetical protein [Deltaproteobacteria bacterium]